MINARLWFAILIALLSGAGQLTRAQSPSASPAPVRQPLVKLQGIDGHTYDIGQMHGSVILVSFGATWCAPCTAELRALEQLKLEYQNKPVKFFWVTIETEGEADNALVSRFAKQRKLTIPVLRDPMAFTYNQFAARRRLPMIVFFGKDGKVDAAPHFGMSSQPENYKMAMRQRLDKL